MVACYGRLATKTLVYFTACLEMWLLLQVRVYRAASSARWRVAMSRRKMSVYGTDDGSRRPSLTLALTDDFCIKITREV